MRAALAAALLLLGAGCLSGPDPTTDPTGGPPASGTTTPWTPVAPTRSGTTHGNTLAMIPGGEPTEFLQLLAVVDTAQAAPQVAFEAFDTVSLNVADLLGDGRLQVVSQNDNLRTYVIDPLRGHILAELTTLHTGEDTWLARDINGVAIGDVTGNGSIDLAILNSASTLTILEVDRANSTQDRFAFRRVWRHVVSAPAFDPDFYATHPWFTPGNATLGADGNAFIAHLPGEPGATVLVQTDGIPGHFAFRGNGSLRWHTSFWDGNAGPWAGILKPGGPTMAVFTTDSGHVVTYHVASGAIQWTFDARANGAVPGSISVMPTVVDLEGEGRMSVFVGARVAVNDTLARSRHEDPPAAPLAGGLEPWMERSNARYFLLDADGRELWNASFPWGNPMMHMLAAAVEVNGDGVRDFVVLDWNTIGHNPGRWQKTGPANLFALDGRTGAALWTAEVDSTWSNKGIAIADFLPGTPGAEILVEDQRGARDGFSLYDLQGRHVAWMPLPTPGWQVTRGPALADFDGDGRAELVVPVAAPGTCEGCPPPTPHCLRSDVGCRQGALLVYRTAAPNDSVLFANAMRYATGDDGALAVASSAATPLAQPGTLPAV